VNGVLSDDLIMKVGVHQGSVLRPLLFIIVLEVLSSSSRIGLPWEMLYMDDLILIADSMKEVVLKFKR